MKIRSSRTVPRDKLLSPFVSIAWRVVKEEIASELMDVICDGKRHALKIDAKEEREQYEDVVELSMTAEVDVLSSEALVALDYLEEAGFTEAVKELRTVSMQRT